MEMEELKPDFRNSEQIFRVDFFFFKKRKIPIDDI